MAALNYEINLQCDENSRNGRLTGYPVAIAALFILSLIIAAGLYSAALLYANHLESAIAGYEADVSRLTAETRPLEALETRNQVISLKADLEAELQTAEQPVSETLQQVNSRLSANLNISSVTVEKSGVVYIIGTGTKMQSVAAYSQTLENLSFVEAADITEIKLAGSGLYSFHIELRYMEGSFHEAGE